MSAARHSDFTSLARARTKALWDAYHDLRELQTEWNALTYGDNLADGVGANLGYNKAEVGAVLFDTINEIKLRIFDTGHATNLAKLL